MPRHGSQMLVLASLGWWGEEAALPQLGADLVVLATELLEGSV